MFRIGEFSRLTQVSIRMLRYYDEEGLLKPAETDPFTGYRLYSAAQIPTLNRIVFLRDLGFGIAEIKNTLQNWSDDFIADQLDTRREQIEHVIRAEQDKLARIEQAKKDIRQKQIAIQTNVSIKAIPSYAVLALRRRMPDYYAEGLLWKEMAAFAKENSISVSANTFTIYHDEDYREKDVDIEVCAPVAKMGESTGDFVFRHTEAVPIMASTMVYGPFENINGAYLNFAGWLQAHSQYKMGMHSRQIVHRGPWNEEDPEKYLTEIQVPLENR